MGVEKPEWRKNLDTNVENLFESAQLKISAIPEDIIYHYTTPKGLEGIIGKKVIWATHTDYLNDFSEIQYGYDLILNAITKRYSKLQKERLTAAARRLAPRETASGDSAKKTAAIGTFPEAEYAFLLALKRAFTHGERSEFYVASFCESSDLLSQWRGYGLRGGGYSIGFKVEKQRISTPDNHQEYGVLKICYDTKLQENLVNKILTYYAISLINTLPGGEFTAATQASSIFREHLTSARWQLTRFAIRVKDEGFREENEWRFYAQSQPDKWKDTQFRESNGILIPYLELPWQVDGIRIVNIRSGPNVRPHLARNAASMLTKKYGLTDIHIDHSKIPYSGS